MIVSQRTLENKYGWHGTAIKVVLEGDWSKAKRRVEEYLRRLPWSRRMPSLYLGGAQMRMTPLKYLG